MNYEIPEDVEVSDACEELLESQFLARPGAYVLCDGQFGSTGKGLAASLLAAALRFRVSCVYSNAGPNSGHTFYHESEKVVLRQLPSFAVKSFLMGYNVPAFLDAGAIIDPAVLAHEHARYKIGLMVHPNAAVVSADSTARETGLVTEIGSTGKGTGAALAAKIMREKGSTYADMPYDVVAPGIITRQTSMFHPNKAILLECSQGFSLGINQRFFPHCTSRECTVQQALLDAEVHPYHYRDAMMVLRTYPIRVAGNSGPGYRDQEETSWGDIGQEPELTTVTQKQRRLFTWSNAQFIEALYANRPGYLFLNFCNYVRPEKLKSFIVDKVLTPYRAVMGHTPKMLLLGFGPMDADVFAYDLDQAPF